jgi:hypothetical protein
MGGEVLPGFLHDSINQKIFSSESSLTINGAIRIHAVVAPCSNYFVYCNFVNGFGNLTSRLVQDVVKVILQM